MNTIIDICLQYKKILKYLEELTEGQKRLEEGQKNLTQEVSHIKTTIKIVATKADVETTVGTAKAEIQADILNLGAKQTRKSHEQDNRLDNLEEHTGTHNPNKN